MYSLYLRLNLHVADSDTAVIRAARRKLKPAARSDRDFREQRHQFYRTMLRYHSEARSLYREVMHGTLEDI